MLNVLISFILRCETAEHDRANEVTTARSPTKMHDTERDLALAAVEIEKMANATLLPDLQSAWETFVFRLERAWDRTEREVRTVAGR